MILYKYMRANYALEAIRTNRIKVTTLNDVNVCNEFLAKGSTGPDRKTVDIVVANLQIYQDWCSDHGFISLSMIWNNDMMWKQYADAHHGIVLGFEVCNDDAFGVKYTSCPLKFSQDEFMRLDDAMKGRYVYGQKGSAWTYEQEWRMLIGSKEWEPKIGRIHLWGFTYSNRLMLRNIMLGADCVASIKEVRDALGCNGITNQTEIINLQRDAEGDSLCVNRCDRYENGVWRVGVTPRTI